MQNLLDLKNNVTQYLVNVKFTSVKLRAFKHSNCVYTSYMLANSINSVILQLHNATIIKVNSNSALLQVNNMQIKVIKRLHYSKMRYKLKFSYVN